MDAPRRHAASLTRRVAALGAVAALVLAALALAGAPVPGSLLVPLGASAVLIAAWAWGAGTLTGRGRRRALADLRAAEHALRILAAAPVPASDEVMHEAEARLHRAARAAGLAGWAATGGGRP